MKEDSSHSATRAVSLDAQAFPTATFVIGIGELGRDVLAQLGERWSWVQEDNPNDQTLGHVSLLHIDPEPSDAWEREVRKEQERLTEDEGRGSAPDDVIDFLFLRTLGLIRFQDGYWEVARPHDTGALIWPPDPHTQVGVKGAFNATRGHEAAQLKFDDWKLMVDAAKTYLEPPAEIEATYAGEDEASVTLPPTGLFAGHQNFRRRFYTWQRLEMDPVESARRLPVMLDEDSELSRFIGPLLARIREGNAPLILLQAIRRMGRWEEGTDPSPWRYRWLDKPPLADFTSFDAAVFGATDDAKEAQRGGSTRAPRRPDGSDNTVVKEAESVFKTTGARLTTPMEPWVLLSLDWESHGWTFGAMRATRQVYRALPFSPSAGGFEDQDCRLRDDPNEAMSFQPGAWYKHLQMRLEKKMARYARQGLIRMWSDLRRTRRLGSLEEEASLDEGSERIETLKQSIDLLEQFVIVPGTKQLGQDSASASHHGAAANDERPDHASALEERTPSAAPERREGRDVLERIAAMTLPPLREERGQEFEALTRRMKKLGMSAEATSIPREPLLKQLKVKPNDAAGPAAFRMPMRDDQEVKAEVRHWVRNAVRRVLSEELLAQIQRPAGELPVNIRIFVAGDLGESSVRVLAVPILQVVQAEVRRLVSPIIEGRFDGTVRPVSVVPIFSMPHPADVDDDKAPEGATEASRRSSLVTQMAPAKRRVMERLVVDCVHSVRHWVEKIPARERLIFEVLVNGRVSDRAVMNHEDAVSEIRAYIWMNARSAIGSDGELSRVLYNREADVLATVSCRELSFPTERARAWWTNRYARDVLNLFQRRGRSAASSRAREDALSFKVDVLPGLDRSAGLDNSEGLDSSEGYSARDEVKALIAKNRKDCEDIANTCTDQWPDEVQRDQVAEGLLEGDYRQEALTTTLQTHVHSKFNSWKSRHAAFDGLINDVRRLGADVTREQSQQALRQINKLVSEKLPEFGVDAVEVAVNRGIDGLRQEQRESEQQVKAEEDFVRAVKTPNPEALVTDAYQSLRDTIEQKPDWKPMQAATLAVAALFALILGPLVVAILSAWLPGMDPVDADWALRRLSEALVFAGMFFVFKWLAGRWMNARLEAIAAQRKAFFGEIQEAMVSESMPQALHPFIRSRLRHRWESIRRGHAARVSRLVERDQRHLGRVVNSARARHKQLQEAAEWMGVIVKKGNLQYQERAPHSIFDEDSPTNLFHTSNSATRDWLIHPHQVGDWYVETMDRDPGRSNDASATEGMLRDFSSAYLKKHWLGRSGDDADVRDWRKILPFADGSLLDASRERWLPKVTDDAAVKQFRTGARDAIGRFATRYYGVLGYGAKFRGYESFDEDGLDTTNLRLLVPGVLAEVLSPHELNTVTSSNAANPKLLGERLSDPEREALRTERAAVKTGLSYIQRGQIELLPKVFVDSELPNLQYAASSDDLKANTLRANATYLLLMAKGIRERSFQNLRRYRSSLDKDVKPMEFLARLQQPEDDKFYENRPLHPFMHRELRNGEKRDGEAGPK